MLNKLFLGLLLVPVSAHSMESPKGFVVIKSTGYSQDGLTMPRKGTIYQSHTYGTEFLNGDGELKDEDDTVFVGIVSKAEAARRVEAEEKRLAALALQISIQKEKERRVAAEEEERSEDCLGGLWVEGDYESSSDNEIVFSFDYGAPLATKRPRRSLSQTQLEKELDEQILAVRNQILEIGSQIVEIWRNLWWED